MIDLLYKGKSFEEYQYYTWHTARLIVEKEDKSLVMAVFGFAIYRLKPLNLIKRAVLGDKEST